MSRSALLSNYTPWTVARSFIILVTLPLISVWTVRSTLPTEEELRVVHHEDGATRYVIVPIRDAATMPTFIISGLMACIAILTFLRLELLNADTQEANSADASDKAPTGGTKSTNLDRIARGIIGTIGGLCLLAVVYLLYLGLIADPFFRVRSINVNETDIQFQSLLRSWSVPRERVQDVRVEANENDRPNHAHHHRSLIVQLVDGTEISSLECKYPANSPRIQRFEALGRALKAELLLLEH